MNRTLQTLPVSAKAFFRGYLRFQVAYTTDQQQARQEDGVYLLPFPKENIRRFWTYAAADDALQDLIDGEGYESATLLGFNWWHWLTRGPYGAWHSFYVHLRVSNPGYAASARLD